MRTLMLITVVLAGCAQPPKSETTACAVSPTVTRVVNGHTLVGKEHGDVFIYPATDRALRSEANGGPEKLLVFLAKIPAPLPSSIAVAGTNLSTGSRRTFDAALHASEFGTEWGTNFSFPDAGCWQLSVNEGGNQGRVVIEVR